MREHVSLITALPHHSWILHLVPSSAGPPHGFTAYLQMSVLPPELNPYDTRRPNVYKGSYSHTFLWFFFFVHIEWRTATKRMILISVNKRHKTNICRRTSSVTPWQVKHVRSEFDEFESMADCIIVAEWLGAAGPPPTVTFLGIHEQTQMLTQLIPENCSNGYIARWGEEVHPLCPSWSFFLGVSLLNIFSGVFPPSIVWIKGPRIEGVAYCTDCEAPWGQLVFMVYFENWLDINCPQSQDRTWHKAFNFYVLLCSSDEWH